MLLVVSSFYEHIAQLLNPRNGNRLETITARCKKHLSKPLLLINVLSGTVRTNACKV